MPLLREGREPLYVYINQDDLENDSTCFDNRTTVGGNRRNKKHSVTETSYGDTSSMKSLVDEIFENRDNYEFDDFQLTEYADVCHDLQTVGINIDQSVISKCMKEP